MPLTTKGEKIKKAMVKEYGEKKGKQVFYANENKENNKGVKRSAQISAIKKKIKK